MEMVPPNFAVMMDVVVLVVLALLDNLAVKEPAPVFQTATEELVETTVVDINPAVNVQPPKHAKMDNVLELLLPTVRERCVDPIEQEEVVALVPKVKDVASVNANATTIVMKETVEMPPNLQMQTLQLVLRDHVELVPMDSPVEPAEDALLPLLVLLL